MFRIDIKVRRLRDFDILLRFYRQGIVILRLDVAKRFDNHFDLTPLKSAEIHPNVWNPAWCYYNSRYSRWCDSIYAGDYVFYIANRTGIAALVFS
jgi:hypothetical protein